MNRGQVALYIEYLRTVHDGSESSFVRVPRARLLDIAECLETLRDSLDAIQSEAAATPHGETQQSGERDATHQNSGLHTDNETSRAPMWDAYQKAPE